MQMAKKTGLPMVPDGADAEGFFIGRVGMVSVALSIGNKQVAKQFQTIAEASAWVRGLLEDRADIRDFPTAHCDEYPIFEWFGLRAGYEDGTDEFLPQEVLWPSFGWPKADYSNEELLKAERKRQIVRWKKTQPTH
jgi:hypothetical protein